MSISISTVYFAFSTLDEYAEYRELFDTFIKDDAYLTSLEHYVNFCALQYNFEDYDYKDTDIYCNAIICDIYIRACIKSVDLEIQNTDPNKTLKKYKCFNKQGYCEFGPINTPRSLQHFVYSGLSLQKRGKDNRIVEFEFNNSWLPQSLEKMTQELDSGFDNITVGVSAHSVDDKATDIKRIKVSEINYNFLRTELDKALGII